MVRLSEAWISRAMRSVLQALRKRHCSSGARAGQSNWINSSACGTAGAAFGASRGAPLGASGSKSR
eukprot:scaffold98_cov64-Phaeocystis_antarctica.AAC.2